MTLPAYDPDNDMPPAYDDRAERIVKVPNPVNQARGRASRNRGHKAEREWIRLIEVACNRSHIRVQDFPEQRGTSGTDDGHWNTYSFEIKSRVGDWPAPGTCKQAWQQARNRCGWRTPIVVTCLRRQGAITLWRCWTDPETFREGHTWISDVVIALLTENP